MIIAMDFILLFLHLFVILKILIMMSNNDSPNIGRKCTEFLENIDTFIETQKIAAWFKPFLDLVKKSN